ncbi:sulfatase [Flagellimonas myxillae]|uniref:sulfatase family protein n=1 Tax=Flagellimonas myxillae TaxID=2942214 RepID=UPI00201F9BDD|nr:sulfatase-like hydrolase/transferase [Muricauda myxillae]MCL6265992.1 sulfatase-like hydrolase/transferase [Muricauda myxillae]
MRPFYILKALLLTSLFISCAENEKRSQNTKERPNIILIMTDDQGWGDTGYNGHPHLKTPNLDDMAAKGVVFNRFYSASAVCSPTRGSVMTGRHPLRYGICTANCGHIKPEEITLGEMVKEVGYTTGHFGKWHLGTLTQDTIEANRGGRPQHHEHYAPPWEHGFDTSFVTESKVPTWDPMVTPDRSAGDVSMALEVGKPFNTSYWTGPGEIVTENLDGDDSRVIMDRVIPFIENASKNKQPFLSIIWFHTPHLPVLTGENYRSPYGDLSEDQQHFYGTLTAMDEQIGRLRNTLEKLGVDENTVLFFTSDNGPEGKSTKGRTQGTTKGLKGRKRSLYEGGIRVPGIMEWPGKIPSGLQVQTPCFTSDYFPTIAQILDIDMNRFNRPFDGVDLLPIVSGAAKKRDKNLAFRFNKQAVLINGDYKIYSKDDGHTFELYNLANDPSESEDLAATYPDILKQMVAEWNQWKVSQEASAAGNDYTKSQP